MPALRLTVSAVLAGAGIVLGMVSPAVAASAAANISILSAGPDSSGNPYNLTIVADDANGLPIQTMTAFVESASNQLVATVPMMPQSVSDPASQTWVASPSIAETALPAGAYSVTVNVTDADESDNGLSPPAQGQQLSFVYVTSSLTATAAPPSVTQGSQQVTFSGTLTGTAPGTGSTPVGIANAPVDLSGATSNPVATTDTNGNFSYTATGVQPGSYAFSVAAASAYPAASANVSVSAQQATTSMTVSPSPASVTQGMQTVTFNGTVTAAPPAPASPVGVGSGVPVYLSIGANGTRTQITTTNDANGDFSYPAHNVAPGTVYSFSVNSTPLYTAASVPAEVTAVAAPTTISVTPSPGVVTFGSPNVTFSGTVTALPQGSTTAVAVIGAPVDLNGSASPVATTDSNGHFTYTATGITQNTTETFSVPASSTGLYSEFSDPVPIDVDPGTTAITASASPPDINLASSTVTFTGTVTVTPFGSTTPEGVGSGVPVYLSIGGGAASKVTTTDDASGDFTYTATDVTQAADYSFSVNASTFYPTKSVSVPIGFDQVISTLKVTPSPTSVTEGSQTVTFTGTLTGVSPSGGPPIPVANAPVDLSIGGKSATQVKTTDANGDFTYKVAGISKKTAFDFSVGNSANYTEATENITVPVDQARTRIRNIRVTPAHLKYGQNATLRATVQYLSGKTWTALPRTKVKLAEGKTDLRTVTTASNGTFAATLPSTHGPGWTAVVGAANLTLQTSAMGNLSIALPLKFDSFSARLLISDKITATGCLQVVAPTRDAGPGTFVDIQYSGSGRGPWRSLGTLPLHSNVGRSRTCRSDGQSYFSGAIHAKLPNAYYRADFVASDSFQSAVSSVIHAWKYPTKIVSFTANKRTISKDGTVRFKGRLEVKVRSWRGWGGQKITILYNYKGTSIWNKLATAKTNSHGYFMALVNGSKGNFVAINYAMYAGNASHLACMSKGVAVRISNGNDGAGAVAGPVDTAGDTGTTAARPSISQLERLSAPAVPMLPEFFVWPSIASLARVES